MADGRGHAFVSNVVSMYSGAPSTSARSSRPADVGSSDPDQLFKACDGRHVQIGQDRYRIEIYSVSDENGSRWVQLGLLGHSSYMVTLNVPAGGGLEDVLIALSWGTPVSFAKLPTPATSIH